MKLVKITLNNSAKIMKAFSEAQGKARERMIDSYNDLERIIGYVNRDCHFNVRRDLKTGITKIMTGGMTKKALEGTVVHYDFAQNFPNAYRYAPSSTHFDLTYKSGDWYVDIDSITRSGCPRAHKLGSYTITFSESAIQKILEMYAYI